MSPPDYGVAVRINEAEIKDDKRATDPTALRQLNTLDMNHWLGSPTYDSVLRILFTVVRILSAITSSFLSIQLVIVKPDNNQRTLGIEVITVNAVLTTVSSGSRSIFIIVP